MVEVICLQDSNISFEEYDEFLHKIYDDKSYARHIKRNAWYSQGQGYRVYLALLDGKIVGQTCNFRADAIIHGVKQEWWWSVDTYVLPEARGFGIGKLLQKKQREDKINVGAAWFSAANALILSKVAGNTISYWKKTYYPISRYFSILLEKFEKKVFKKDVTIPVRLSGFYSFLNSIGCQNLVVDEVSLTDEICDFISKCLSDKYDFYIDRTYDYLLWKWYENPDVNLTLLSVKKTNKRIAVIAFSDANGYMTPSFKGIRIIGSFIKKGSGIAERHIVRVVYRYLLKHKIEKDGVLMLSKGHYFPSLSWPNKGNAFYSTYSGEEIRMPYLDFSDEDMEQ